MKLIKCIAVLAGFLMMTSSISAQTYVNGDQALQILMQTVEDMEAQGQQLWDQGQLSQVHDLSYKYQYSIRMIHNIQAGAAVANAVATSLPLEPYQVAFINTGDRLIETNFQGRVNSLRTWAIGLLTL